MAPSIVAVLAIGGLLTAVVAVALFQRAREASAPGAFLAVALALFGSIGAAIHGGYDLANVLHPPLADVLATNELPNPVDPRGVLTFAGSFYAARSSGQVRVRSEAAALP